MQCKYLRWLIAIAIVFSLFVTPVYAQQPSNVHKVIRFVDAGKQISSLTITGDETQKELVSQMPKTIKAYVDGSDKASSFSVSWRCLEDYDSMDDYYYEFVPVIEGYDYTVDENTPYVGVFVEQVSLFSTADNEKQIYDFLTNEMKLNKAAATGVLANIYKESGFNPNATGDKDTSYGICQWHDATNLARKQSLIDWCKANGYDYKTLSGQLKYLQYELSANNYKILYNGKKIYDYLLSVSNDAQGSYNAASYWCLNYEIPADKQNAAIARGNLAKDTYWPKYNTVQAETTIEVVAAPAKITLSTPKIKSCTIQSYGLLTKWNSVKNASGYEVWRKAGSGSYKKIATTKSVSYQDKKVSSGTTYTYKIIAYAGNVKSSAKTIKQLFLQMPEVTVTNTSKGIQIKINPVKGAKKYQLYRKLKSENVWHLYKNLTTTSYTDTAVKSATVYDYTARAVNGSDISFYRTGKRIAYVTRPSISKLSGKKNYLQVTWKKNSKATGYQLSYQKTGSSVKKVTISSKSKQSVKVTGLKKGTYSVKLRTYQTVSGVKYYSSWSSSKKLTL